GDRADRVLQHHLPDRKARPRRHDAPVDAEALLREPLDDVGSGERLGLRLGERLALLLREERRDVARALAHERRRAAHDLAALGRHQVAPDLDALLRRLERAVEIGTTRVRDAADLLAGRRIDDGQRAPLGGGPPLAVDEKLRIDVSHRAILLDLRIPAILPGRRGAGPAGRGTLRIPGAGPAW